MLTAPIETEYQMKKETFFLFDVKMIDLPLKIYFYSNQNQLRKF